MGPDLRVVLTQIPIVIGLLASNRTGDAMDTPPLPSNPSIDNPPLTPEPIREDPESDTPNEPENDPVKPDSRPKKVHGRSKSAFYSENPFACRRSERPYLSLPRLRCTTDELHTM